MTRGFEIITDYQDKGINLPLRKTSGAAGYDIEAAEDMVIPSFKEGIKPTLVPTGLKAYFPSNEYLMLVNRSSGPKKGLVMANGIGIIDHDYYNNQGNEGHIYFQYYNTLNEDIIISKGDIVGQAIFNQFMTTDNDNAHNIRTGGFGSTDIN